MDNYYSLLGCSEDASKDEIRKQYKQLALKTHPDKNGSVEPDQFQRLSEAVHTLTDNKEKYKYDSKLLASRGCSKIITDEVNFDQFSLDGSWYIFECRCGGQFLIATDDQAIQYCTEPTVIDCNGCSLSIRVLFKPIQS